MPDPFELSRSHRETLGEASRALRQRQTTSEEMLWEALRSRRAGGARFRRQHRLGPFIVDFFCFAARLMVEVDGSVHDEQQEYDAFRDDTLQQAGYRTLRVTADDVEQNLPSVLVKIEALCRTPQSS